MTVSKMKGLVLDNVNNLQHNVTKLKRHTHSGKFRGMCKRCFELVMCYRQGKRVVAEGLDKKCLGSPEWRRIKARSKKS